MSFDLLSMLGSIAGIDPNLLHQDPTQAPSQVPNASQLNQAAQTPIQPPVSPQHHGMFGIHGTLRDILGTLGDALLVNGGANPMYREARDNEQVGDAMAGYQQDPLKAIQGVAGVNGKLAESMLQNYNTNQIQRQQLGIAQEDHATKMEGVNRSRVAAMIGSANPATWEQVLQHAHDYAVAKGLPTDDIDALPKTYSQDARDAYVTSSIDPEKQRMIDATGAYHTGLLQNAHERNQITGDHYTRQDEQASVNETGRDNRATQSETGRDNRATQRESGRDNRFQAGEQGKNYRHDNPPARRRGTTSAAPAPAAAPAVMVQHNPSTNQYRYSTDGGRTWNNGTPK